MSLLTSHSNPLTIATVQSASCAGRIGMTICPGKHQANAQSGQFQRDLQLDLDLIASWGAAAVVSLLSHEEFPALKVEQLGTEVENRDMLWFHLPIQDQGIPDDDFERRWVYAGLRLRELLRAGKQVLVHCRSGLGRTGLVAARLLVELGTQLDQALAKIREARPGTLHGSAQVNYLQGCGVARNDAWLDRVLGCLLGGAVGDAFGYAVEFDSLAQIRQRFGKQGLTRPLFQQDRLVVSDDTQMTLFTLEGILRSTDAHGGIVSPSLLEEIRHAYLDWYDTQSGNQAASSSLHGTLGARPSLRVKRAPGNTCLAALKVGARGTIAERINDSKGCGGVMRTAPIGFLQDTDLFDLGARAAALTHGHVEGWTPAGILPRIISRLIRGEEKFLAVRNGYSDACEWGHVYGEAADTGRYELARKLARKMRFTPCEAIRLIGEGWVGDEALAVAIYAFLSARNFTDAICRASNHDGDSDSTASIAGQLWGARHGVSGIPHEWIRRLDVLDEILLLVRQMQGWQRQVDREDVGQHQATQELRPCIRMIEMTHELHALGYQKIRVFPHLSNSACHWRIDWAPSFAFRSAGEPPHVRNERELVRYSSGDGWEPFGWRGVQGLAAQELAQQFLRQYPELARAGQGDDWAYAGWLTRLLGEVRRGRLPYMMADWPLDFSRGIPMTQGTEFPLPPGIDDWLENPEAELLDEDPIEEEPAEETATPPESPDDDQEPEPSHFDFTNILSRTHGLVALYHQGDPYLLQVTQMIWGLLPEPRDVAASALCAMAGQQGQGKLGLHQLLEHYLHAADEACEQAAGDTERGWLDAQGALDWSKIEHTFALMDDALLATAYRLSHLIEKVINPG